MDISELERKGFLFVDSFNFLRLLGNNFKDNLKE